MQHMRILLVEIYSIENFYFDYLFFWLFLFYFYFLCKLFYFNWKEKERKQRETSFFLARFFFINYLHLFLFFFGVDFLIFRFIEQKIMNLFDLKSLYLLLALLFVTFFC